ncbi:hypothetical protein PHLGIDRAFT_102163 [Phlebiopsis gigantea 11061_1 CR5-6]|uniref:Cytochrome b5 heme-binding domain-containing protein n=1 Tax=Phlebiopsis gigantea (strain 11061_1 CR5-6) TaxID=745531 RepID=A0A0C3SDQ5_PHLG1|nr:hypothetical protein PHLGIDRAFT_102163 [Phlebiopsis gigantea 11061_1 CR5-6]
MPATAPAGSTEPRTPAKTPRTAGSVPGSPWAEFPLKDNYPKVADPSVEDREVSTKQANRPFLAYAQYRERREAEHAAWLKRKEEREEKLARGEEVGPEEPDPQEEPEVGCLGLLKFLVISLVVVVLAGKFFTGSYLWEQDLTSGLRFLAYKGDQRLFSERMLATFSGEVESMPIYIAIDGDVFDVSSNRATYGPGGSYHFMAGRDAARAFATGCFATHQTHDIRGLSDREMAGLEHWKKFFADSTKYRKVGRVLHEPIDPASPIPEHCDPKKVKAAPEDAAQRAGKSHDEL